MALSLGTTTPTALYLGTTAISAAYLGVTQVYTTGGGDAYAIGGASPELVAALTTQSDGTTAGEYFRKAGSAATFSGLFTHLVSGPLTMFDSTGTLVWAPHNLVFTASDWSNWPAVGGTKTTGQTDFLGGSEALLVNSAYIEERYAGTFIGEKRTSIAIVKAGTATTILGGFLGYNGSYKYLLFTLSGAGTVTTSAGVADFTGADDYGIESLGDGWYKCWVEFTAIGAVVNDGQVWRADGTGNSDDGTFTICFPHAYRSDLGGMADNPDQTISGLEKYVPTTTAAKYLPRRQAYRYNSGWELAGMQMEAAAATQLLHGTDSFATQTETVTAQAYTLQFQGTGSITLSGAHSATLNGTGANDLVSLTFTPSAGTLTLTPAGTVDYPMLAAGSTPSSYIPNMAGSGTVARAAETLTIAGADTPANTTAMSISMKGLITYADTNTASQAIFLRWLATGDNYILWYLSTFGGTGTPYVNQRTSAVTDFVLGAGSEISAGVNSAFNIAARHGATFVNAAASGTAFTENSTPTAIADLSSTTLQLGGYAFNGYISEFRMWGADIGDSGIAEVTT